MMKNIKLPDFSSVVKVGDGRGFVFEQKARPPGWDRPEPKKVRLRPFVLRRCIITAAHCLPRFPEPYAFESFDRVYRDLLGALGGKPSVWALLLFADPVADIAVLGSPDDQEMFEQSEAYDGFVEPVAGDSYRRSADGKRLDAFIGQALSLVPTTVNTDYGSLLSGPTLGGQSGSPILNEEGQAVGVVAVGGSSWTKEKGFVPDKNCGPQPRPMLDLPARILGLITHRGRTRR